MKVKDATKNSTQMRADYSKSPRALVGVEFWGTNTDAPPSQIPFRTHTLAVDPSREPAT